MSFANFDNDIVKFLEAVASTSTNSSIETASREILEMLHNKKAGFTLKNEYWFIWRDGKISFSYGQTVNDAFAKLGKGDRVGDCTELEWFMEPRYGRLAIDRLSSRLQCVPDYECAATMHVINFHRKEIRDYLNSVEGEERKKAVYELAYQIHEAMELMCHKFKVDPFLKIRDEFRK